MDQNTQRAVNLVNFSLVVIFIVIFAEGRCRSTGERTASRPELAGAAYSGRRWSQLYILILYILICISTPSFPIECCEIAFYWRFAIIRLLLQTHLEAGRAAV